MFSIYSFIGISALIFSIAYMKALASSIGIKHITGNKKRMVFSIDNKDFEFDVWMDVSDLFEREIRLSVTGNDLLQAQIKNPERALSSVNKMFEKYLEILKNKDLKK